MTTHGPDVAPGLSRVCAIACAIYAAAVIAVAALGVMGDSRPESIAAARVHFTHEQIDAGAAFARMGIVSGALYQLALVAGLALAVAHGLDMKLAARIGASIRSGVAATALSWTALYAAMALISLPHALYAGYYRSSIFGLMSTDLGTWLARWCAAKLISIAISASAATVLTLILAHTKRARIYLPAAVLCIGLALSYALPRVVTPLFYTTAPIAPGAQRDQITALAAKSGMAVEEIFVIEKSAYSLEANAYFIGAGATGRIYLYDTLLKAFRDNEVALIVAHELCHFREEHALLGLLLWSIGLALAFPLGDRLARAATGVPLRELAGAHRYAALTLMVVIASFAARPLENGVSREMERRCDRYAIALTRDPDGFVAMQRRLAAANRSSVLPHPAHAWITRSHPPVLERISLADEHRARDRR